MSRGYIQVQFAKRKGATVLPFPDGIFTSMVRSAGAIFPPQLRLGDESRSAATSCRSLRKSLKTFRHPHVATHGGCWDGDVLSVSGCDSPGRRRTLGLPHLACISV